MDMRALSEQFFVSPQIIKSDLAVLQTQGIKSIICNRPDGEEAGQPPFDKIAQDARDLGLAVRYIPVSGGVFQAADVAMFADALRELPKPILAYCRSGARSATLWSLANADTLPLADILSATKAAGYDVEAVVRPAVSDRRPV